MSDDVVKDPKQERNEEVSRGLEAKKLSAGHKLKRYDSLDMESGKVSGHQGHSSKSADWLVIWALAFQSIGIVYGDIGTSPLYVYASTFTSGINHNDDILGVLSLILYTLTLIPLVKYVFIVLRANDNGDGGTFALYSLICRYAKVGLIPSQQAEDRDVSNFELELPSRRLQRASRLQSTLEKSKFAKLFLLFATLLGTSMVIGDGVLTPCMSVLSAVGGITEATSKMTEDRVMWISVVILVLLFMVQRFGTDKVGYTFAPVICVWFAFIGGIGVYNFIKYDPTVLKALYPKYIVDYFKRNKKDGWISLGGVVLAITGTEALFADVGHFTVRSIQISMCCVTYPSLVLAYVGQASYLRMHHGDVFNTFYKSIPGPLYWPMFVVAVLASIIASQAMISATFSIIQQSLALGCFPRVRVVHTSAKYEGQVYIPEINYILMLACIGVTLGFKTTVQIGNAYGIAVVFVMTLTSSFLVLVMIMIWKCNIFYVIAYIVVIGSVELLYLSSVLYKFDQGGYLPLAFAATLMLIMYIWNNVYRRKYYYELEHEISPEKVKEIVTDTNFCRIPGLAFFYSELVQGIPPIFKHYVENVPALHSVLVFVSIKSLPISKVPVEERFLFLRVDPKEFNVFRCVVRYGYTDVRNEEPFEKKLVERLKEFIREDIWFTQAIVNKGEMHENGGEYEDEGRLDEAGEKEIEVVDEAWRAGVVHLFEPFEKILIERLKDFIREDLAVNEGERLEAVAREIEVLDQACFSGVVHLIGESEVVAKQGSNLVKKIVIDYAYNFMKKNLRQSNVMLDIPHARMVKVGMTYEL
ncbi:LOW QUALITY PROTEIN: K_trans domain-containing protein, partial [Cephalotus follicularis]